MPSLMTPVSDDKASLTLIMEMLRGINSQLESQNSAATEDRTVLHDIVLRVDRIERNQLERKVKDLEAKVDDLETDRDRRRGIAFAIEWAGRFGTPIVLLIAAIVAGIVYFRGH